MGKNAVLLLMLAEAIGLTVIYYLLKRLSLFTKRTLDDVPEFLRHINHEAVKKLFDEAEEKADLSFGNRRRGLRCRLDLAREYVRSLHHNVTIVYHWGETEWQDMVRYRLEYDEETRQKILSLHREAITFLVAARVAMVEMWLWSVVHFEKWPVLPLASVATLRTPGSVDLLHAYQRVKDAAAALASVYGEEHSEEIGELM
jgi:hypothetical protein